MIVLVAGEDRAHYEQARAVAERVLIERVPWLEGVLRWGHPDGDPPWFALKDAHRRARAAGLDVHGHFGGEAGLPEARQVRAQLLVWKKLAKALEATGDEVVLGLIVRDVDHRPARRDGADQARRTVTCPFAVVLGFCDPEAEAWSLCMFDPRSDAEREALAAITAALGFSPITETQRLTSTRAGSERDVKKIWSRLAGDDPERGMIGLRGPIEGLRARGQRSGLRAFVDELVARAVPHLAGSRPAPR